MKKKLVGYVWLIRLGVIICDPGYIGYVEHALWCESDHPMSGESTISDSEPWRASRP